MNLRRESLARLAALGWFSLVSPRLCLAVAPKRLGVLAILSREDALEWHDKSLSKRLADRGWIEGRTLAMEWRFAALDDSRYAPLAKELVDSRVDVIATWGLTATRAAQQATRTIPIATGLIDPVGYGLAKSLSRPGGNITGLSYATPEITLKEFELFRALVPRLAHLVFLARHGVESIEERARPVVAVARAAGIIVEFRRVETLGEIEEALRTLPAGGRGAFNLDINVPGISGANTPALAQLAIRHRVAMMEHPEEGGLMAYSLSYEDEDERFVAVIDRLLRGADPASTPFEIPTRSAFVINRKTATALGIRIPPEILLRADRVID
jgi:putative tryptophan/tyrosine transport system substrate-binding protein